MAGYAHIKTGTLSASAANTITPVNPPATGNTGFLLITATQTTGTTIVNSITDAGGNAWSNWGNVKDADNVVVSVWAATNMTGESAFTINTAAFTSASGAYVFFEIQAGLLPASINAATFDGAGGHTAGSGLSGAVAITFTAGQGDLALVCGARTSQTANTYDANWTDLGATTQVSHDASHYTFVAHNEGLTAGGAQTTHVTLPGVTTTFNGVVVTFFQTIAPVAPSLPTLLANPSNINGAPNYPTLFPDTLSSFVISGVYESPDQLQASKATVKLTAPNGTVYYWTGTGGTWTTTPTTINFIGGTGSTFSTTIANYAGTPIINGSGAYSIQISFTESGNNIQSPLSPVLVFYPISAPTVSILTPWGNLAAWDQLIRYSTTVGSGGAILGYRAWIVKSSTITAGGFVAPTVNASGALVAPSAFLWDSGLVSGNPGIIPYDVPPDSNPGGWRLYLAVYSQGPNWAITNMNFGMSVVSNAPTSPSATAGTDGTSGNPIITLSFNNGVSHPYTMGIQYSDDGGVTWTYCRGGQGFAFTGITGSFVDQEAPLNATRQYRVWIMSGLATSNWGMACAMSAACPSSTFWLHDPNNPADDIPLQVKTYNSDTQAGVSATPGLGNPFRIVTGDTTTYGEDISLSLQTVLDADYQKLAKNLKKTTPLLLKDPDGYNWWIQWTKRTRERVNTGSYSRPLRTYTVTAAQVAMPATAAPIALATGNLIPG